MTSPLNQVLAEVRALTAEVRAERATVDAYRAETDAHLAEVKAMAENLTTRFDALDAKVAAIARHLMDGGS
jgi:uncharacterized membrane-anchored protein YhcB (DUF1043 family)